MLTDGPKPVASLDRHTRDLAGVFDAWRDQIEELRPFEARSFDDALALRAALGALEGPSGNGGLLADLASLAAELIQALGWLERDRGLRALG
jgi:hypothetical protein